MEILEQKITEKTTSELIKIGLRNAISYQDYRNMVNQLALQGKSTGLEQTEGLSNYTALNDKRMKRLDKTIKIRPETVAKMSTLNRRITWLVLTESWCGDAAQTMPIMNKMAEVNPNISLKILLRDEHLELMNRFLYNDTLSIPRLIVVDNETANVIGDWGPRPSVATKTTEDYKKVHGKLTLEFKQDLQVWYNKDKGENTIKDLLNLLPLE